MCTAKVPTLLALCLFFAVVSSHAEMAIPGPGATPDLGPGVRHDTGGDFLGFLQKTATDWKTGMDPNTIDMYLRKFENYNRQIYSNRGPLDIDSWEFRGNAAIAEAAGVVNRRKSRMPPPHDPDVPPEVAEGATEVVEMVIRLVACIRNGCTMEEQLEIIKGKDPWDVPSPEPLEPCEPRPCPEPRSVNRGPRDVAQQEHFVKTVLALVVLRRLDLQEAVMALNAYGIAPSSGTASWSTVELLEFLIPDEVDSPETFARIVVENFRSKAGRPIAFEVGDSRCTVVRRSDMLGEAGYHDLTCDFH